MIDELFLELRILAAQAGRCLVRGAEEVGPDGSDAVSGEHDTLLQGIDEGEEFTLDGRGRVFVAQVGAVIAQRSDQKESEGDKVANIF